MISSPSTHTAPGRGQQEDSPWGQKTNLILKGKKIVVEQKGRKRRRVVL